MNISVNVDIKPHLIFIFGIESLSSSARLNLLLLKLVKKYNTYLIVDESNLVKNHNALRTKNIQKLADVCKYKLILNGTPISKNEADLYSQWYILDWRILGYKSFWSFASNHLEYDDYGKIKNVLNVEYLTRKIAPYTYQVKKSECLKLPKKKYFEYGFNLTYEQYNHYEDVRDAFLMQVDEYDSTTIYRLFTALQHVSSGNKIISSYKDRIKTEPFFKNILDNPRIQKLLDLLSDEKHIIWCKYTSEIKNIETVLKKKYGKEYVTTFYGELTQKQRIKNIEKFKEKALFFIANKTCAGYGLNLQFCNMAVYYSNDFDFATRSQSEDRIYRIGQNKEVILYDITANNTIDELILKCLLKKKSLVNEFKVWIEQYKNKKEIKNYDIYRI